MFRTTLFAGGVVHAVTMPDIPAHVPGTTSVRPSPDCHPSKPEFLPAYLARQTTDPSFTEREVTCQVCLRNPR